MTTTKPVATWGHKADLWDAAKAEAKNVLERIAKTQARPIAYSELSLKIRSITFQPDGHDFHGPPNSNEFMKRLYK